MAIAATPKQKATQMTTLNHVSHMIASSSVRAIARAGSPARRTRQLRSGSLESALRAQTGLRTVNRPVICVNRVPGTPGVSGAAIAEARDAHPAGWHLHP